MAGSNDTNVTDDSPKVLRYIYVRVYDIVDLPEPEGPKINNAFIYIYSRMFYLVYLVIINWHANSGIFMSIL